MATVMTKPMAKLQPKPIVGQVPANGAEFQRGRVKKDGTPWGKKGGMSKVDRRVHIKMLEEKMKMWQRGTPAEMIEDLVEKEVKIAEQIKAEPEKYKGLLLRMLVMNHLQSML